MDTIDRERQILQDVADGRLSPEEAAVLLDEAEPAESPDEDDADEERAEELGSLADSISRVQVNGTFQTVRIIGDPTVREAVAEGTYVARREGDTLVIGNEWEGIDVPGFVFAHGGRSWRPTPPGRPQRPSPPPPPPRPGAPWESLFGWTTNQRGGRMWRPTQLTVRMRPDLPLDAEISAGSIHIDRIYGPLRIAISAGSAKINDARGPVDLEVSAGSVRLNALLTEGTSRIWCDAGSVRVRLQRGSSVKVRARADFGKLTLPDNDTAKTWVAGGGAREVTVGNGDALLDVQASLGNVAVTAD